MSERVFPDDGYSDLAGTVPARGPWPALSVRYRPALPAELDEYRRALGDVPDGRAAAALLPDLLYRHVRSWDARESDGRPVAVTREALGRLPSPVQDGLFDVLARYAADQLSPDARNLRLGVYLLLAHPGLPSCAHCAQWLPPGKGTGARDAAARKKPQPRPPHLPTPCAAGGPLAGEGRAGNCPKIPPDAAGAERRHAVEITDRNWRAYRHYLECAAVGEFPADPLVRHHAALIREAEHEAREYREEKRAARLESLLQVAVLTRAR